MKSFREMKSTIPTKSFSDLSTVGEGMVFLGCGEPEQWQKGLNELWIEQGFIKPVWFQEPFTLETSGGRTDLVFPFSAAYFEEDGSQIGRLAMWRLRFGDCSWISDYKVNYAKHHNHLPIPPGLVRSPEPQNDEPIEPVAPVRARPIARMAPVSSRDPKTKVKKTAGKPTRRSTRQKKLPARFRQ